MVSLLDLQIIYCIVNPAILYYSILYRMQPQAFCATQNMKGKEARQTWSASQPVDEHLKPSSGWKCPRVAVTVLKLHKPVSRSCITGPKDWFTRTRKELSQAFTIKKVHFTKSSVYTLQFKHTRHREERQEGPRSARFTGIMPHNSSLKRFPSDYSSYVQPLSQGKH